MSVNYKFYVKMDGDVYGPYTAAEVSELGLLSDTMVTEESMNGEWLPASKFDFDEMVKAEGKRLTPNAKMNNWSSGNTQHCSAVINEDGSITRRKSGVGEMGGSNPRESRINYREVDEDYSYLSKWNWGAFTFGWIWGVFNGVYWTLATIIIGLIPSIGPICALCVCVYLGIKGNSLSWNAKRDSISYSSFVETQKKWSKAGFWVFWICFALGLIFGFIYILM